MLGASLGLELESRGGQPPRPLIARPSPLPPTPVPRSTPFDPAAAHLPTNEVERHLQRAVDELRIMRSRGNIYFV